MRDMNFHGDRTMLERVFFDQFPVAGMIAEGIDPVLELQGVHRDFVLEGEKVIEFVDRLVVFTAVRVDPGHDHDHNGIGVSGIAFVKGR